MNLFDVFELDFVDLACENIRLSSLFAAGDVSRGGASATHTDDLKSVRNPVRSADWSARNVPSGEERGETDVIAGYC